MYEAVRHCNIWGTMIRHRSLSLVCREILKCSKARCSSTVVESVSVNNDRQTDADYPHHAPVLTTEVLEALKPSPGKVYVDMTFGAGGHSSALLDECSDIEIIAVDRDTSVRRHEARLLEKYGHDKIQLRSCKFTDLPEILSVEGKERTHFADGVLFDVGVSSMQFGDRKRGFALKYNGPLDMRMNKNENMPTAADILNNCSQNHIARILKYYGEEKKAKQIARRIVEERQTLGPIKTTRDLQDIVREVYEAEGIESPKDKLNRQRHPATLTFQALRIFVNDELNELYNGLKVAHRMLKPRGTCAAITFHSLEHRIVNQILNSTVLKHRETGVTEDVIRTSFDYRWKSDGKVIRPSQTEIDSNSRARSAQLRTAQKLV